MARDDLRRTVREVGQATRAFYDEIGRSPAMPTDLDPVVVAQAVLCVLTQRLSGGEARDFAESVSPALGALLAPCVAHREEPPERFDAVDFFRRVSDHLDIGELEAERLTRAVFTALHRHLPSTEVDDVGSQLPHALSELWRHPSP